MPARAHVVRRAYPFLEPFKSILFEPPCRHRRNLTRRGEPEAIVPVGPGPWCELSDFGVLQHCSKIVVSHECSQGVHIVVIPDVHHVSYDPVWHGNRLVWCHPPDVFARKGCEECGIGWCHSEE